MEQKLTFWYSFQPQCTCNGLTSHSCTCAVRDVTVEGSELVSTTQDFLACTDIVQQVSNPASFRLAAHNHRVGEMGAFLQHWAGKACQQEHTNYQPLMFAEVSIFKSSVQYKKRECVETFLCFECICKAVQYDLSVLALDAGHSIVTTENSRESHWWLICFKLLADWGVHTVHMLKCSITMALNFPVMLLAFNTCGISQDVTVYHYCENCTKLEGSFFLSFIYAESTIYLQNAQTLAELSTLPWTYTCACICTLSCILVFCRLFQPKNKAVACCAACRAKELI